MSTPHGTVCEITDVLVDDLDTETGRPTDAYSYRLRDLETGNELREDVQQFSDNLVTNAELVNEQLRDV